MVKNMLRIGGSRQLNLKRVGTRKEVPSITLMAKRTMLLMCGTRTLVSGILRNGINPRKFIRSILVPND